MQPGSSPLAWQSGPTGARPADASLHAASDGTGLRAFGRRIASRRPPIAWSLAILFVFKGLVCFATVAFPISSSEPRTLLGVLGAVALVGGCWIWLRAEHIPMIGYELIAAITALATSGVVAQARTHGGMMLVAFAYPWIAIYAAHFFPRRAVTATGALISISFGVALAVSGLSHIVIYWVIVIATVWSICILLGNLSDNLRREATTDHLTGLFNRGGFIAAALRERALADRTGTALTVAAIDLDDFKQINDRAGHAAGDQLLATIARRWRERMRASDILARHGGDEFVLLLPCTTEVEADAALAHLHHEGDPVNWSMGVSEWQSGEELDAVLARADRSLYETKLCKQSTSGERERSTDRPPAVRT